MRCLLWVALCDWGALLFCVLMDLRWRIWKHHAHAAMNIVGAHLTSTQTSTDMSLAANRLLPLPAHTLEIHHCAQVSGSVRLCCWGYRRVHVCFWGSPCSQCKNFTPLRSRLILLEQYCLWAAHHMVRVRVRVGEGPHKLDDRDTGTGNGGDQPRGKDTQHLYRW